MSKYTPRIPALIGGSHAKLKMVDVRLLPWLMRAQGAAYHKAQAKAQAEAQAKAEAKAKAQAQVDYAFHLVMGVIYVLLFTIVLFHFVSDGWFIFAAMPVTGGLKLKNLTFEQAADKLANDANPFTNLGDALASIERRGGHQAESSITVLPGGDGALKLILGTQGRDNIGLRQFKEAFELPDLAEGELLFLEANGVEERQIQTLAKALIQKGYRPLGARLFVRCFDDADQELPGADYVRALGKLLGKAVDVRSYGTILSAPALSSFTLTQDAFTEREGADSMPVLWFTGKAGNIFNGLNGTEGGLPISEKAMGVIFGDKRPGQPRLIVKLGDKYALVKGNFSPMAVRAFLNKDGGYVFLTRADFDNTEEGKAEWRKGYDFVFIEDDTPKGPAKDELKTGDIRRFDAVGNVSGWLIAQAQKKSRPRLVSYQVLALLAQSAGLGYLAPVIRELVSKKVKLSIAQAKLDLDKMNIDPLLVPDVEKFKQALSLLAPTSSRQERQISLGGGMSVMGGYVHMNTLFNEGVIVVGDEFDSNPFKAKKRKENPTADLIEDVVGGKDPILDHQQLFVGKAVRLHAVSSLLQKLKEEQGGNTLGQRYVALKELLFGNVSTREAITRCKWILAFAPSLTRGSILMNAEDVARLAGDDDGDALWFKIANKSLLEIFKEIKKQAQGNTNYAIENNKQAQLPSEAGERHFSDMLTLKGDELLELCFFIMAPNKGQGPVGYLANLCTVLITVFEKVDNGNGGLKFENVWVERLQAILNLMQQTAIDAQKRIFLAICLLRWTLADLRKEKLAGRAIIPGHDYPGLGWNLGEIDPNTFTADAYKAALVEIDVQEIPCHWKGDLIPLVTPQDAQYNIRALGSWLVWETVSLLVTSKPAAWCDEMAEDAKGGLDPDQVKFLEDGGPDLEALFEGRNLSDEVKAKVKAVWVEKPSELYSWKSAPKNAPYQVMAPPGLQLNHTLALQAKAACDTGDKLEVDFDAVNAKLQKLFSVKFDSAKSAHVFIDMMLNGFYLEAFMNAQTKAQSERFQTSQERSGVESLGYIVSALETVFTKTNGSSGAFIKLADAFGSSLNPRENIASKTEKVSTFLTLMAWWTSRQVEGEWALKALKAKIPADATKKSDAVKQMLSCTKAEAKKIVYCQKASNLDPAILAKVVSFLDTNGVNVEKEQAKTTWLLDDGIACCVKALDQHAIIASKRDVLKLVGTYAKVWTDHRAGWTKRRTALEILLATFHGGDVEWFKTFKSDYLIVPKARLVKEVRKDLKANDITPEREKALKAELKAATKASKIKGLLELLESDVVRSPIKLDALLDPKTNPAAKVFKEELLSNSAPILNIERAWQRALAAGEDMSAVRQWTWELGDWVKVGKDTGYDRNGEPRKAKMVLFAHPRCEWVMTDTCNAELTKAILSEGVSFYKLTQVPNQNRKTWRYFDAFVFASEKDVSVWSLARGVGHLISLAIPAGQDEEKYQRMNHLGHLEASLQAWREIRVDRAAVDFQSSHHGYHELGLQAEIARVKALKSNNLMASWGAQGFLFPVTWGLEVHSWAGRLTKKAINGRAWAALAQLGDRNERFMPPVEFEDIDGCKVPLVTSKRKPLKTNGTYMPFTLPKGDRFASRELQRAQRDAGVQVSLDDTTDLTPFSWSDEGQHTYDDWLTFIEGVAAGGTGSTKALVMSALWFGGHTGRIGVLDPKSDAYVEEIANSIKKRLIRCPAYEVRLHLEDLFKGDWVAPVYKDTDPTSAKAFYSVIRKIAR